MTVIVIGIALALPMGLFVCLQNIETVTQKLHDTSRISLYLKMNLSKNQLDDAMRVLRNNDDIKAISYIPPEEGLKDLENILGVETVMSELKQNPLPGVIIVQPDKKIKDVVAIKQLVAKFKSLPQVDQVQFDMIWLDRLSAIINLGQRLTYALMALFTMAVLLIVCKYHQAEHPELL